VPECARAFEVTSGAYLMDTLFGCPSQGVPTLVLWGASGPERSISDYEDESKVKEFFA
jgi:hypothetical protein